MILSYERLLEAAKELLEEDNDELELLRIEREYGDEINPREDCD